METYKKTNKRNYDLLKEVPLHIRRAYAKIILRYGKPKQKLIDLGFGSGSILIPLAELNKNLEIHGIDYSKKLFKFVKNKIGKKAILTNGDILKLNEEYDIVHFKAILHCFQDPQKALDKISDLVDSGGIIITGHENSQLEDRIEQIFKHKINEEELELLINFYFDQRKNMGKSFLGRKFPAGNSKNAVDYLCRNRDFKLIKIIKSKNLEWNREFRLEDLIYAIKNRTYKVFDENISKKENEIIVKKMIEFSIENKIDLKKKRHIPASFVIYLLKKK